MKVAINSLPVTNLSGRHVLVGHFSRIVMWSKGQHEFFFLFNPSNQNLRHDFAVPVNWIECPGFTSNWIIRMLWERCRLPFILKKLKIDAYFSPAGTVIPGLNIPQISFAQNPWCLVSEVPKTKPEKIKAAMQRLAYANAMKKADMMVFNSEYVKRAYRENAGGKEKASKVIYQAVNNKTHDAAAAMRSVKRNKHQIVCVSVMASHKGVDTLVKAVGRLRHQHGVPAELILIGPWPDEVYRHKILRIISGLDLTDHITIKGYLPEEDLWRFYAESRLFCLMSWCESFGIPSVEAQAFGTPVVSSNCCAIPEICGHGGVYPEPGDVMGVAAALASLLTDDARWNELSAAAIANAEKYRWNKCSWKFLEVFDRIAKGTDKGAGKARKVSTDRANIT